ncbi:hypothetical protein Tco_0261868 [Tanacetum coccineum]
MGTKVTSSSGSVLEEPEIQKLQMQAKISNENCLETLLNAETLHEMDSKSALSVIKLQFERFINSDLLKPLDIYSRSFSSDREVKEIFRDYTTMTAETFKETIIQNLNSIEHCKVQEFNHRLQVQEMKTRSGIVSDEEIDKQNIGSTLQLHGKDSGGLTLKTSSLQVSHWNRLIKNAAGCVMTRVVALANLTLDSENTRRASKKSLLTRSNWKVNSKREGRPFNVSTQLRNRYNGRSTFANPKYLRYAQNLNARMLEDPMILMIAKDLPQWGKDSDSLKSFAKENRRSNVFRKEREQYHEIQDLKAQMQDKNIAISELKKLIENCKGKSVETQFNKPSVVRQPNAQRIPKPSVLGKPTPFSNSPEMRRELRKQKPFLKFNELQCPTCKKCLYSANHDECVLEYLSKLNPRASAQIKDAKSHNTTKRYVPVEKTSESKKPERLIPKGHRWVPTGNLLNSCTGKVENEPTHGSNVDIPHIHACKQTLGLSAGTSFNGQKKQKAPFLNVRMTFEQRSSSLVLHQMTSDHNCLELGIQDHNNDPSSFKAGSKCCSS